MGFRRDADKHWSVRGRRENRQVTLIRNTRRLTVRRRARDRTIGGGGLSNRAGGVRIAWLAVASDSAPLEPRRRGPVCVCAPLAGGREMANPSLAAEDTEIRGTVQRTVPC